MSFSSDVKTELSKLNNLKNKQEVYAELIGYLISSNCNLNGKNFKFSTENEYNINRFTKLLNNTNINDYKIEIQGKTYVVNFKYENITIDEIYKNVIDDETIKAFIRGTFLGRRFNK